MLKINKAIWTAMGVVVVVIAVMLYLRYTNQLNEQTLLENSMESARVTQARLTTEQSATANQIAQLKSQLAQVQSQLDASKASFPKSVETIEYGTILFKLAESNNLTILDISASGPDNKIVGNVTYQVTSFRVGVEGKISNLTSLTAAGQKKYISEAVNSIVNYAKQLSTGDKFTTATAKVTNIIIPSPLSDADIDLLTRNIRRQLLGETIGFLSQQQSADLAQATGNLSTRGVTELTEEEIMQVLQQALMLTPDLVMRGTPASQAVQDRLENTMAQSGKIPATIQISVYSLPR